MRGLLQDIVDRVPGAYGAAVIGLDGITVERVSSREDFNIDLVSAEGINVVKRAIAEARDRPEDRPEEITISSRSGLTILRALGADYFLCVVVGPDGTPGRARYEAWRAGVQLEETVR
ncbi:MAG: roadblock/LC7 domain-containing protein [Acidobacteriota bacterium]